MPQQTTLPNVQLKFPDRRNGIYYLNYEGKEYHLPSVTSVTSETMPKPSLRHGRHE